MKIFLVIFRLWTSDSTRETKNCNFKREATLLCHGDFTPKKWHTYEKCFVHPVVDSKVNPNFKAKNGFRRSFSLRNRIHLKWLRKLYSFLGSLSWAPQTNASSATILGLLSKKRKKYQTYQNCARNGAEASWTSWTSCSSSHRQSHLAPAEAIKIDLQLLRQTKLDK